jgi:hypothetical protein
MASDFELSCWFKIVLHLINDNASESYHIYNNS